MFVVNNRKWHHIDVDSNILKEKLQNGVYELIQTNDGFYLEEMELNVPPELYGAENRRRRDKVLKRIQDKNKMGVIFSGEKGSGKTHTMKAILKELSKEMPVIVVNSGKVIPALSELFKILGDFAIAFDEFEKNFDEKAQMKLLTMFDGLYNSDNRRYFFITANEHRKIRNEYFSRPDRFRYVFFYSFLDIDTIEEFLRAKNLSDEEIKKLKASFKSLKLNFDLLKNIVEEYQFGEDIETIIKDLGIKNEIILAIEKVEISKEVFEIKPFEAILEQQNKGYRLFISKERQLINAIKEKAEKELGVKVYVHIETYPQFKINSSEEVVIDIDVYEDDSDAYIGGCCLKGRIL